MSSLDGVYLGGFIRADKDEPKKILWEDKEWRENYPDGNNPLDGFIEENGDVRWHANPREICWKCLDMIRRSRAMIANLTVGNGTNRSTGTIMEMMYARFVANIPVIVVTDDLYFWENPWIQFVATRIFTTIEQAETYIEEMLK